MRIKIGVLDIGGRPGLVLCDETGLALPNQTDLTFTQSLRGGDVHQKVTVTLAIDGDHVAFDPAQQVRANDSGEGE